MPQLSQPIHVAMDVANANGVSVSLLLCHFDDLYLYYIMQSHKHTHTHPSSVLVH